MLKLTLYKKKRDQNYKKRALQTMTGSLKLRKLLQSTILESKNWLELLKRKVDLGIR